jgi:serine/threonine protein kinase
MQLAAMDKSFGMPELDVPEHLPFLDPEQVVEYAADGLLGSGGFGSVRHARLRSNGKACAVKVVPKRTLEIESLVHREVSIHRLLSHPNVCGLIDAFEDEDYLYLVLELIDGCDLLDEMLEVGRIGEGRAAEIMRQVFQALQYCHEGLPGRCVLHRDIKPENIMLRKSGGDAIDVKLIDFGMATICQEKVQTPVVGTAVYLAPESANHGLYSRASDMWSAGVVLAMMLTGEGPATARLSSQQATSVGASSLLRGLLNMDADARPSAAMAAQHAWTRREAVIRQEICLPELRSSCEAPVEVEEGSESSVFNAFDVYTSGLGSSDCFDRAGSHGTTVSTRACTSVAAEDFVIFADEPLGADAAGTQSCPVDRLFMGAKAQNGETAVYRERGSCLNAEALSTHVFEDKENPYHNEERTQKCAQRPGLILQIR